MLNKTFQNPLALSLQAICKCERNSIINITLRADGAPIIFSHVTDIKFVFALTINRSSLLI